MDDHPSPGGYAGRSPEGTRAGSGGARRSARLSRLHHSISPR